MYFDITDDKGLTLASIKDIGCARLFTITGRASSRDYVDLYFVLKRCQLSDLLDKAGEKCPELDRNLILKSLVYFEDVENEKILFKDGHEVSFEIVKKRLMDEVKALDNLF